MFYGGDAQQEDNEDKEDGEQEDEDSDHKQDQISEDYGSESIQGIDEVK